MTATPAFILPAYLDMEGDKKQSNKEFLNETYGTNNALERAGAMTGMIIGAVAGIPERLTKSEEEMDWTKYTDTGANIGKKLSYSVVSALFKGMGKGSR